MSAMELPVALASVGILLDMLNLLKELNSGTALKCPASCGTLGKCAALADCARFACIAAHLKCVAVQVLLLDCAAAQLRRGTKSVDNHTSCLSFRAYRIR